MGAVYHSGISYFSSDIDKPVKTDVKCAACGEPLEGKKVNGPRSWAGAMGGTKTDHFSYLCPHAELDLHVQIVGLLKEQAHLASEKLRAIVQSEIDDKRLLL